MKNSSSERGGRFRIEPFVYRDQAARAQDPETLPAPLPGVSEAEVREREQRARREARVEAEQSLGADLEQGIRREQEAVRAALRDFEQQRERYFLRLEQEVVQLVLAIARKVLHREAHMDPLLLAASARVALDQLAAGTAVKLFVPASRLAEWERLLCQDPLAAPPQLVPDAALEPAGCRLETTSGATDLSWETQLQEIERGFADLLQRRTALACLPAAAAAGAAP